MDKPIPSGLTEIDIHDDDKLRFIARVLESDAPREDRNAAAQMARDLRTRVRKAYVAAAPSATGNGEDERKAFEGWMAGQDLIVERDGDSYSLTYARRVWEAWQSRASLERLRPVYALSSGPISVEWTPADEERLDAALNEIFAAPSLGIDAPGHSQESTTCLEAIMLAATRWKRRDLDRAGMEAAVRAALGGWPAPEHQPVSDTAKRRAMRFLDRLEPQGCNEVTTLRRLVHGDAPPAMQLPAEWLKVITNALHLGAQLAEENLARAQASLQRSPDTLARALGQVDEIDVAIAMASAHAAAQQGDGNG